MNKYLLIFTASLALLWACNDVDDSPNAQGDVFIVTKNTDSTTTYGLSLHSYSYYGQASVKVTVEQDPSTTYTLESYKGNTFDFYYETGDSLPEMPTTGNYHFTIQFENGDIYEDEDALSSQVLDPPVIEQSTYDTTEQKALLAWESISDADFLILRIYYKNELVFLSPTLAPSVTSVSFTKNSSAWLNSYVPQSGTTYTVRVLAYMYETGGDSYNIQAVTYAESNLLWGD